MKKRNAIRLASFCAAITAVALIFAAKSKMKADAYRLQLENTYSHNLDGLGESTDKIALILQKAEYTTAPKQMSTIAAQLMSESQTAKSALSQLPNRSGELKQINRFLSQVGNYAMTVSKESADGLKTDEKYAKNIAVLKKTAQKISDAISQAAADYNNREAWLKELDRKIDDEVSEDSFEGSVKKLEESLTDYPTLVYDGPYSDHITEKMPLMTTGKQEVTEAEAKKKAAKTAGVKADDLKSGGTVEGKIPCFVFTNGKVRVSVSKNGGFTVNMRKTRAIGDTELKYDDAVEKARKYLENMGLAGFKQTYYFADEGVCVVNFAYLDGDTLCYTDLVKVGIAMDNGEIMLYEAAGYLTNHRDRIFKAPEVSKIKAEAAVSEKLDIKNSRLALIPTEGGSEIRCYEFLCEAEDKKEIMVFVNADTGEEEDILILLKSDGGTLAK